MRVSIRHRMLAWLAAVLLPIGIAGFAATHVVSEQLSERIGSDLSNTRRLEAARINEALRSYEQQAESMAIGRHPHWLIEGGRLVPSGAGLPAPRQRIGRPPGGPIEGIGPTGPFAGSDVVEVQVTGSDGVVVEQSPGYSWQPYDPTIVATVVATGAPRFGNAFRNGAGRDLLGLVVPIIDPEGGGVVGAMSVELNLGPISDFVVQHEGFGETSEVHIAQPTPSGDAEFITQLRFDRDAAFQLVVPKEKGLPINQSLVAGSGEIIEAKDYRSIDSILAVETIERTGWGLVVKIDRDEALAPVAEVRRIIALAAACAIAAVLVGWAAFLRPITRRLRLASTAAARVVAGEHVPIADQSSDEIGDLSRAIDGLSSELEADEQSRAEVEAQLQHRATHDELTGLFNRVHATMLLRSLDGADPGAAPTSLLFLDLDDFKSVNDSFGHLVGDEILVAVSSRIEAELSGEATLARWGGDEFVVILPGTDEAAAEVIAEQVRALFAPVFVTSVGPQSVSVSLGAATVGADASLDQLLAEADRRMFDEKSERGGRRSAVSRLHREIDTALTSDRIAVHYQPLVAACADRVPVTVGFEALVRVRDGDRESPPHDFLAAAKDSRLGALLDRRVHEQAIATFAGWRRLGVVDPAVFLSLNLSEASSSDRNLPDELRRLATLNGLEPSDIVLEVSERSSRLDPTTIASLRVAGFPLALDDFGTQYANIDRLVDLQPDIVKIDRRWLGPRDHAPTDQERRRLERLVRLARDIGAVVALEGVETEQQRAFVTAIDADYLQGFVFAAPLDEAEATEWLTCATRGQLSEGVVGKVTGR